MVKVISLFSYLVSMLGKLNLRAWNQKYNFFNNLLSLYIKQDSCEN